jgi:hypothetical protein
MLRIPGCTKNAYYSLIISEHGSPILFSLEELRSPNYLTFGHWKGEQSLTVVRMDLPEVESSRSTVRSRVTY